jgi:hypothetical protein
MRKQVSTLTAFMLSGFLCLALPACSDRNKSETGGKSSGDTKGSTSSPGSGSGSSGTGPGSGTGGSTSGSGTSTPGGTGSGGSGS